MSIFQILVVASFAATLCYAAYTDFRYLEISNKASVFIALLFLPASLTAGLPLTTGILLPYAFGLGFLLVGAAVFAAGLIGGGDVKLLASVAIWFEPTDIGRLVILVLLLGGCLAALMLAAQKLPALARLLGSPPWLACTHGMKQPIPYGIAISLAGIIMIERLPVLPETLHNLFNG